MKHLLTLALLTMVMSAQIGVACPMGDASQTEDSGALAVMQWQGQYQAPEEPLTLVAQDASQWAGLWQRVSREAPVALDTEREMAVGIFLGLRNSGGYGVKIVSAQEEDQAFVVTYKEIQPGPMDIVTMALTTPYVISIVPKTSREVVFKKIH